jgi:hypothetical protein
MPAFEYSGPSKAAAFHSLTWVNSGWRASLARLRNQRERAWWRRVQASQWMACQAGRGRARSLTRAADEQVVARAGGGDPGPGIPALALGAVP